MASEELPEGWAVGKLDECSTLITKGSTPTSYGFEYKKSGINFIRVENLENGRIDHSTISVYIDEITDEALKRSRLQAGDLLFSIAGTIGRSAVVTLEDLPANTNQALAIIRGTDRVFNTSFLEFALASSVAQQQANEGARGGGMNNISLADVKSLQLPIAPLAEQTRIVAKVDELLKHVNAARDRLAKVPKILKAFRQSVLAAACSGRLTEDWCEPNIFSASQNVKIDTDAEELPDLPEAWRPANVESVCSDIVDCPHSTPKWAASGIVCLRTTNFLPGLLDLAEVRYVSNATYEERTSRVEPRSGDVVYSREGGILGIACQIPLGLKACLGQRMMLMRPDTKIYSATFLMHVLNSPITTAKVKELTGGSASPHLNVSEIRKFILPLPPMAEQHEIVRRVETLFQLADKIEKRVEAATKRADKLTQSVLAKAFRGELVPTEAELAHRDGRGYEPASVLLERIKVQPRSGRR